MPKIENIKLTGLLKETLTFSISMARNVSVNHFGNHFIEYQQGSDTKSCPLLSFDCNLISQSSLKLYIVLSNTEFLINLSKSFSK